MLAGGLKGKSMRLYATDESIDAAHKLPRTVSISAIVRWILIALVSTEKEFQKRIAHDKEGLEVREYVRERLRKLID